MSDKLNFKHLITFNLRVTTREWSVDMASVLDPQSLPEGPVIFSEECELWAW